MNVSHRLRYLDNWSQVGGAAWGDLVGAALLEEVWQWR